MYSRSRKIRPTILAVDDISLNLTKVEQILRGKYEVVAMNSGTRALNYLVRNTPDLILLDIRMDKLDGIQTLREMRTMDNCADIPVIMLTAKRDRETVLESASLGIVDYIVKPFDPEDLLIRIESALNKAAK